MLSHITRSPRFGSFRDSTVTSKKRFFPSFYKILLIMLVCFLDWPPYGPRWLPLLWVSHADNNVQEQKKWSFLLSVFFSRVPREISLLVSVDRTVYISISKPITDQRNFISMLYLDQSLFTWWGWGKSSLIQSLDPWLLNQESIS